MSDGKWSGGAANRTWARPGSRRVIDGDAERGRRLYAELADTPFWDEICGRMHPLAEHAACREHDRNQPNVLPPPRGEP